VFTEKFVKFNGSGTPAITSIVDNAELSVVRSPATVVPAAQVVPLPKLIFPENVCAGVTVTPCAFNIIIRLVFTGIGSDELQIRNCVPVFDKMVHPVGKPNCCALPKNTTEAGTWMIGLNLACAIVETGPVLPTVTIISMVAPTDTRPEFDGNTLINGLACANTFNVMKDVASVKSMILKNFIFLPYFKFVICFNSIY
jgi:hypothetical protein